MVDSFSRLSHKDVFRASEIFQDDYLAYDDPWLQTMRGTDWSKVQYYSVDRVKDEILRFLNKWKCRLPYSDELAEGIRLKFESNYALMDALKPISIETYEPDSQLEVEGKMVRVEDVFCKLFSDFVDLPFNFGTVAATKLLHFPLPRLVVMWDTPISERYGVKRTARGYVYRFIPMMHEFADAVISSYCEEHGVDENYAIWDISRRFYPRTLAKMLDEYNYITITRGIYVRGEPDPEDLEIATRLKKKFSIF